jgi:hypothetical protein
VANVLTRAAARQPAVLSQMATDHPTQHKRRKSPIENPELDHSTDSGTLLRPLHRAIKGRSTLRLGASPGGHNTPNINPIVEFPECCVWILCGAPLDWAAVFIHEEGVQSGIPAPLTADLADFCRHRPLLPMQGSAAWAEPFQYTATFSLYADVSINGYAKIQGTRGKTETETRANEANPGMRGPMPPVSAKTIFRPRLGQAYDKNLPDQGQGLYTPSTGRGSGGRVTKRKPPE